MCVIMSVIWLIQISSIEFTHDYFVCHHVSQMNYSNLYPTSSYNTIMCDIIAVRIFIQISSLEFIHNYNVCHHVSQMTYLNLVHRVHTLLLCVSLCQSDELFEPLSYEFTHYYYVSSCQSDEFFEPLSYEFTHYYYVCHHGSQKT